jgi:hypothetical protein
LPINVLDFESVSLSKLVFVEVPDDLKESLEFVPSMGYVQVGVPHIVQIKFRPSVTLLQKESSWYSILDQLIE